MSNCVVSNGNFTGKGAIVIETYDANSTIRRTEFVSLRNVGYN